jgi:hypothetical protein
MTHLAGRISGRRRLLAVAAALAAAAALISFGLTSATASPAAPGWSGTEHFTLMSTKQTASRSAVIMTGLFTLGGLDISGASTDTIRLPGGSFKIYHGTKLQVLQQFVSPSTCLSRFRARAVFTIGGGTIKWKGISGSGTATITDLAIGRRNAGKCDPNLRPLVSEQTITATAHVQLAS